MPIAYLLSVYELYWISANLVQSILVYYEGKILFTLRTYLVFIFISYIYFLFSICFLIFQDFVKETTKTRKFYFLLSQFSSKNSEKQERHWI